MSCLNPRPNPSGNAERAAISRENTNGGRLRARLPGKWLATPEMPPSIEKLAVVDIDQRRTAHNNYAAMHRTIPAFLAVGLAAFLVPRNAARLDAHTRRIRGSGPVSLNGTAYCHKRVCGS